MFNEFLKRLKQSLTIHPKTGYSDEWHDGVDIVLLTPTMLELTKAEHQLIGFFYAKRGYGVIAFVEGMGLRYDEWMRLRDMSLITDEMRDEIDEHFERQESPG